MTALRTITAILVSCIGILFGARLPYPWRPALQWGAVLGGIALIASRPRCVILRLGSLSWTREEVCRHFLITGDTGSGKTTSGFHPILVQLTRTVPDWGGLVLGVKGDEYRFISELTAAHHRGHQVIHLQVRPEQASTAWIPPHRFNLLGDRQLPWMTHAKALVDIAASLTEGTQHSFFRPIAQIALAQAFEVLDILGKRVTITRAYELLTSSEAAKQAVRMLDQRRNDPQAAKLAGFFRTTFTTVKAFEQREAIEGTIKTYLGFFLDPDVANVFSSDQPDSFAFSELDRGAIVTVSIPQHFATERRYIHTYLKLLLYYHALRRFDQPNSDQKNLLLLVADEFQDIATASEDGISDHKIVDRVRAAGLAVIAGMQSEVSLDPAIGREKRQVFALNMRSRLIFRASDADGAEAASQFIGKEEVWKKSRSSKCFDSVTYGKREAEEFRIKPSRLMQLRDHTAIIVHPSKRFCRRRLTPLDGAGNRLPWFR
ncbi:MAG: type IV secretion system DNA-binding domain-containing protein [Verrucomicrobiae bacterium]|nr:type IV secretion system DNA-binding domain-containing protein [Verrucomicrobiae bacterium]